MSYLTLVLWTLRVQKQDSITNRTTQASLTSAPGQPNTVREQKPNSAKWSRSLEAPHGGPRVPSLQPQWRPLRWGQSEDYQGISGQRTSVVLWGATILQGPPPFTVCPVSIAASPCTYGGRSGEPSEDILPGPWQRDQWHSGETTRLRRTWYLGLTSSLTSMRNTASAQGKNYLGGLCLT